MEMETNLKDGTWEIKEGQRKFQVVAVRLGGLKNSWKPKAYLKYLQIASVEF